MNSRRFMPTRPYISSLSKSWHRVQVTDVGQRSIARANYPQPWRASAIENPAKSC